MLAAVAATSYVGIDYGCHSPLSTKAKNPTLAQNAEDGAPKLSNPEFQNLAKTAPSYRRERPRVSMTIVFHAQVRRAEGRRIVFRANEDFSLRVQVTRRTSFADRRGENLDRGLGGVSDLAEELYRRPPLARCVLSLESAVLPTEPGPGSGRRVRRGGGDRGIGSPAKNFCLAGNSQRRPAIQRYGARARAGSFAVGGADWWRPLPERFRGGHDRVRLRVAHSAARSGRTTLCLSTSVRRFRHARSRRLNGGTGGPRPLRG